jgi:2-polyprenyl-3-methyl-5-hydroxy-6-metoxy-1,4-benzoquinol methylase
MITKLNTKKPSSDSYHGLVREEVFGLVPRCGGTLLDIGGGRGATARQLKAMGFVDRVGVVDMIDVPRSEDQVDFRYTGNIEGDGLLRKAKSEQGLFDVVLALDVLEHLVDPWSVVAEIHSLLKPDGVVIASIPNIRHYSALGPLLFKNSWTLTDDGILDRTHLRFFVKKTAIELMTSTNLELEAVKDNPSGGRKIRIIRKATFGLANSFTNRQYLIRVRNKQ